ncbi:hypothetical protein GP486_003376 [Trichoglossum hirsutum]|uniref:Transcription factor hoxa13 n=1 Tax=Trichoglossum hirsutum TaxID=265104 RepID=A0A9P8LDC5_9PEZI|nr:hypothetical protein GP486_003376 [Trichoglossum hirsutum]
MAVETNGHLAEPTTTPRKKGRHKNSRSRRPRNRQKGLAARTLNICARLAIWFVLLTVLFKCPSSPAELTDESLRLCKPYLTIRSQFSPYLEPYYNTYATPYINTARPYVDRFGAQFLTPAVDFWRQSYGNYCAPRIEKVREYGLKEWQNTVKPQLEATTAKALRQYNVNLAPHVSRVIAASAPYYELARDNLLLTYYSHLVPAYTSSVPYVKQTYALGRDFTAHTCIPHAQGAWKWLMAFVNRILWPKVRVLYGESVEPQLVRIGERLEKYREGKKGLTAVEQTDSSSQSTSTSVLSSISSSTPATAHATSSSVQSSVSSSTTHDSRTAYMTEEEIAHEKVTEDLRAWHEKFAKAADKGAEDLEDRVKEITEGQISRQAQGFGQALVTQLEETVKKEFKELKAKIADILKAIPSPATKDDMDKADNDLHAAVRAAGLAMKGKAVEVRTWKHDYYAETDQLVAAATEATLEVLDNIRDLGLQEIGMRWAWMEGVTYRDWAKYHALRETLDDWRDEVEAAAKQHKGLARAKEVGDDIEGRGMAIAEEAATELRRLRDSAKQKIEARGSKNDSTAEHSPTAAAASAAATKIGQKALKNTEDAVSGIPPHVAPGTVMSKATEGASEASLKIQDGDASAAICEATFNMEPNTVGEPAAKIPDAPVAGGSQQHAHAGSAGGSVTPAKVREFATDVKEAIMESPSPPHKSFALIAS